MSIDLVPLWAAILALAVFMYVLLDGFDLGVGMLFALRRAPEDRDTMVATVAPVWDFNETWLILGGGGLMAMFPLAFAILIPAVYFPILLMLLGLLFRGVAFEFREVSTRRRIWDNGFWLGSLLATFAQGTVLGTYVEGLPVRDRAFAGTSWDWIGGFPLLTGLGLVAGYSLLGATWLVMKTEGELQRWARGVARAALLGMLAFIVMVSVWTPWSQPAIAERWFSWPNLAWLAPVPVLTASLSLLAWRALVAGDRAAADAPTRRGLDVAPFACAMGLFTLSFAGLAISLWPNVVPPSVTLWDAAAPVRSQTFLVVGTMFLLPVILGYVFWSYWVFRGKVRAGGYHA
ncbi:MAG TPA: cytochrome d ubiquinol oxidase subunit II [Burkholderiaceae bacterium]|nr:cytochrome d ubiquinol oxidase subunit II [Burkholderiaceae bacterium]